MAFGNVEITIVGNLTKDPELRFTQTQKPVTSFSVAVNRRSKDGQDFTSYFDCVAWQDLGEHVAQSLAKGDRVIVQGRFDQRSWLRDDGTKAYAWELTAEAVGAEMRFLDVDVPHRRGHERQASPLQSVPDGGQRPLDDNPF